MGCNYYLRFNECECCGRHDEIHLGKDSVGWQFVFQAHRRAYSNADVFKGLNFEGQEINCLDHYKELFKKFRIYNEYGEIIETETFLRLIESKREAPFRSCEYGNHFHSDGYCFLWTDFS